jgi:hypothetical protein
MAMTLAEELRLTFDLASMRQEAKHIQTPRQWAMANDIGLQARKLRDTEKRLFVERYDSRVETAQRRLIDEGARQRREFKPVGTGADRFDRAAINRQAQRDVRAAHERRLTRIDRIELRELRMLVLQSGRENAIQGMARTDFNRASDRRAGPDRRRNGPE